MALDLQHLRDWLIVAASFGLTLSVWLAVVIVWWRRRAAGLRQYEARLGIPQVAPAGRVLRLWHEGREVTTVVSGMTGWSFWTERLAHRFREAGWNASPAAIIGVVAVTAAVAAVLVLVFLQNIIVSLLTALAVVMLFRMYMQRRVTARSALFEAQFLDAIQIAVRSLRAGHPLVSAFRFTAKEIPAPVGPIFDEVCREQELGMKLEDALRRVAARTSSSDLRLFVTSVVVHLRSGGQLADMMDRLSSVIRDRMKLNRRARVLMAQTNMSKQILLSLPIILFVILNLLHPAYMEPLYSTSTGRMLLAIAGAQMIIGVWLMNRLAVIRY